jgi:signal transduction histidine kinase
LGDGDSLSHRNERVAKRGAMTAWLRQPVPRRGPPAARWTQVAIAIIAVAVVAWLVLILSVGQIRFVIVAPTAKAGFEVFLALLRLFVALVLFLFPAESARPRLRWVALGFLLLGLGGLGFGYLYPAVAGTVDLNTAMYGSLITRSLAMLVIAVGLVFPQPPTFALRTTLLPLIAFALLALVVILVSDRLPTLIRVNDLEAVAASSIRTLAGLTGWHWVLSLVPVAFAGAAAIGAARHYPGHVLGGWLVVAMVLMAGSQLHTLFWPSAYSPVLTTSSLLRLAFTAVVAVGGVLELRHVAAERAASLAIEREYVAQLQDLAALRADFTAIVAHELGNPLATIRQAAELLAVDPLTPVQARALAAVSAETAALTALVADVHTAAEAERDDFAVRLQSVPVAALLSDATAAAVALPGSHSVAIENLADVSVWADPGRIGQVLRNLLSNAAKYAPSDTPITLRATRHGDLSRIFAKFGRGRDAAGQQIPGVGLGLYLSRQIMWTHGSDLTVASTPGSGSTFAFELKVGP